MKLQTTPYLECLPVWPQEGQHILACHDDTHIWVYQAFKPSIAEHAVRCGQLAGPDFSLNRMSWIKPNFLWMMFRSGWATKPDQERILALRLERSFFDALLAQAVPSTHAASSGLSMDQWKQAVASSAVRLQWDPDHDPSGAPLRRRAVQLGLRGEVLKDFATTAVSAIEDITPFVTEQRGHAMTDWSRLHVPRETVYPLAAP